MLYFVGVAIMAIAVGYFNYQMLPKLYKTWQFWFASALLCLLSWASIVMVIILTIKHDISNGKENCDKRRNREI